MKHRWLCAALALTLTLHAGCATVVATVVPGPASPGAGPTADGANLIIVAVSDRPEPSALPGATPRADYRRARGYAGSDSARALSRELARDHGLNEVSAWTIDALALRCILYRIEAGANRGAVLARLASDPRVQLAQPLNDFETLSGHSAYNDPYVDLQHGFATINAAAAQRWSRGEHIRVAVIDTAVDANHPDFGGRITSQRDFTGVAPLQGERHGTQVAGIIAAAANNRQGIVGVAPLAEVLSYRACWALSGSAGARCNSYTLAQALGAAIAAGADIINLSLGGPRDALLERLAAHAIAGGAVVVGAMASAPGLHGDGFPAAVPGVLLAVAAEDAASDGTGRTAIRAPGHQILTLMPGGSYDFATGSSMAAAHVSGAVALLLSLDRHLRAAELRQLLSPVGADARNLIDVCRAVQRLRLAAGADGCSPAAAQ